MPTNNNDVIRVVAGFTYTTGGDPQSNVLHFADTGGGGISDADLLDDFGPILEVIYGLVRTSMGTAFKFIEYSVFNVTQNLVIGTLPWPTFTEGGDPGALDIAQATALLVLPTQVSQVQGRVYVGGIPESEIANSALSAGFVAGVASMGANLLIGTIIAPSLVEYVVYNRTLLTFNLPVSAAVIGNARALGRRKIQ